MKIAFVYPEEIRGFFAREYHVYRLANSLAAAGSQVLLFLGTSKNFKSAEGLGILFREPPHKNLQVIWISRQPIPGIRFGAWFFFQLRRQLQRETDVTHIYTMHTKAACFLSQAGFADRLVFEAHEIFADSYSPESAAYKKMTVREREVYRNLRGVVAISSYLAKCLPERYNLKCPIHVQHDGIEPEMLQDFPESDPHHLIYTGSFQPWKGVPVALEAMHELPEFHLTVVGGHSDQIALLRRVAPNNVEFTGYVTRENLPSLLQKASIGLMPNLLEPRSALYTFPLKLLEYSAAGKGIVASRIPVFEGLETDTWVKKVDPGSPSQIAAGVRALVGLKPDRAGARAWAQQFTWVRQGERLKNFLQTLG